MSSTGSILPDHLLTNSLGKPRRVGFEVEFGGLTFDRALDALSAAIDGNIDIVSPIEARIDVPGNGIFELELDWQYLREKAREDHIQADIMKIIGEIAGTITPLEVVMPPIPLDEIDITSPIIGHLREAGASGTDKSPLYAFGVHINTEIPDLEPATIVRYLKAYSLLQGWLARAHHIDSSRRISAYVDLYKRAYIDLVVDYHSPTATQLIDDYLEHNATRNRALDMLPMFCEIDPETVKATVADPKIKSRPTFHYRMPNCDIGDPAWDLMLEWNRWCLIEILANSDILGSLVDEYRRRRKPDLFVTEARWLPYIDDWARRTIDGLF